MNKIKVWCPCCKDYGYSKFGRNGIWYVECCERWFKNKDQKYVGSFTELIDVLNSGKWMIGELWHVQ